MKGGDVYRGNPATPHLSSAPREHLFCWSSDQRTLAQLNVGSDNQEIIIMATNSKYSPEDFKTISEVCIEGGNDYVTRVVVSVTEHIETGNQFVGIRKFYRNADGELRPTKNGVNFPKILLPQIVDQLLKQVSDEVAQPAPKAAALAQKKPVEKPTAEPRVIDLSEADVPF